MLTPGMDPTAQVKALAGAKKLSWQAISLGQGQEPKAIALLNTASQQGFWAAPVWQPVQPVWQPAQIVAQPEPTVIETVRPVSRPAPQPVTQSVNSAWRPVPSVTTYSSPAPIVQYR